MTDHQWYSVDITEDGKQDVCYFDVLGNAFDEVEARQESCLANPPNARIVLCDREFVERDKAHPETLIGAWQVRHWGMFASEVLSKGGLLGLAVALFYFLFISDYGQGAWDALSDHHAAYVAEHPSELTSRSSRRDR